MIFPILQFVSLLILLVIQPTHADYITTNVYPNTLDQCADYLVPITSSTTYAQCVDVYGITGNTSLQVTCQLGTGMYELDTFPGHGCSGTPSQNYYSLITDCSQMNYPSPILSIPGPVFVNQSCVKGNPPQPNPDLATMSITEYTAPSCDLISPKTLLSTNTSNINVCQNTGGTESFLIQCNSTTAYISYFSGYGCLPTNLNTVSPLFQLGCAPSDSGTSIAVTCSSGNTPLPTPSPSPSPPPQPSNDFWTMILDSPYFINGVSVGAGLLGGGFVVCLCICLCRRRNRKNRNKRPTSTPTPFSTSIQSDEDFSDGIGTPLRPDVLPGVGVQMSSPSKGGQLNNQGLQTPLLSQSNDDDDDEA